MYDPSIGKWISADPIGFDGKDTNLYRYVANSPTNATDPTGLQAPLSIHDTRPPGTPEVHDSEADTQDAVLQGGQEIGPTLTTGLYVFGKMLNSISEEDLRYWLEATSPINAIVDKIIDVPTATWDIKELAEAGASPDAKTTFVDTKNNEHEDAYGTVTVRGGVYWAAEVNYVLWGMFQDVCFKRLSKGYFDREKSFDVHVNDPISLYRTAAFSDRIGETKLPDYRSRGLGISGRKAWSRVGYDGDYNAASAYQLNGERDDEPRTCLRSTQIYKGTLTFRIVNAADGVPTEDGLWLEIQLTKLGNGEEGEGNDGYKYSINKCKIPGKTNDEALEFARGILDSLGVLDK